LQAIGPRKESHVPERRTLQRAAKKKREGKAPSTVAGEFVREEIHHVREGKHGARSAKQAIAIGLSKARRAGVDLPPQGKGPERRAKKKTTARRRRRAPSKTRARATLRALAREPHRTVSASALAEQARTSAGRRSAASRSAAAKKAARTKGPAKRRAAARRAARTRQAHGSARHSRPS
jgi:hypothetical protein